MGIQKEHNALERKRKRQLNLILIITGILACVGLVYLYYDVDFRRIPYIEELERKELDLEIDIEVPPIPDELQDQKPVTTPEYVVPERRAKKLNYTFGIALGERMSVVSEKELEKVLDDIKSLGVGWIRVDMAWNSIQPTSKDVFVWEPFDRIVREARDRGIAVLPIITYTPEWARDASCGTSKCPPANSEEFAEFARTAVLRYAPQGVHVWEIWNEPNIRKFWASGADYARYTDLLKHTYIAIHEVDSLLLIPKEVISLLVNFWKECMSMEQGDILMR